MKKLSLTLLMSLFVVSLFAQTTYKFWVSLTDKSAPSQGHSKYHFALKGKSNETMKQFLR